MPHRTQWALAFALTSMVAACGGGESEAPAAAPAADPAPAAAAIDPATVGNVTGTITLEGTPPEAETLRMNSDPTCVTEAGDDTLSENYVVGADNGGLGNVFIHVSQGLEGQSFPTPSEPVILSQDGCRYRPHVFGIQVGQTLQVRNDDPTLHNIHATPAANDEFNTGQPIEGMTYDVTFPNPEVMLPFQCDVHGWMSAYVGVVDHPFFYTTGSDGAFSLEGLPPGDYVIEAWHEELGTQTQNVTVGESETVDISFTFTVG